MRLSAVERTILINQYEILRELRPDDADHFDELLEILRWGFKGEYKKARSFRDDDGLSDAECAYVKDVLEMYSVLQSAAKSIGLVDRRILFPGFDGNNEGMLLGFAQFLREHQQIWTHVEVAGRDMNSHSPTRSKYGAMLAVFRPIYEEAVREGNYERLVTRYALQAVLDAR